jgi:hypothetical protein
VYWQTLLILKLSNIKFHKNPLIWLLSCFMHVKFVMSTVAKEHLSKFLQFSPTNHHSTIAPFPSISILWGVWQPWSVDILSHPRSLILWCTDQFLDNKRAISKYKPEGRGFESWWGDWIFSNLPNPSSHTRAWGLLSL